MMKSYQFKYKGKTYECCGEDKDLQIMNFNHCIKTRDWGTLKNRIKNQLKWTPKDLVEVRIFKINTDELPTVEEAEKYLGDMVKEVNNDKTFW